MRTGPFAAFVPVLFVDVAAIRVFQGGETVWSQQIRREYLPEIIKRSTKVAHCFLVLSYFS